MATTTKKAAKKRPAAKKANGRKRPAAKKAAGRPKANGRVTPKAPPSAAQIAKKATTDGVFDPRVAVAQVATQYPPFKFNSWDGETVHELPHPLTLDPVEIQMALGLDPADDLDPDELDDLDHNQYFELLDNLVPEAWAAIQQMPIAGREQVLQGWTTFIEEAVGPEGKGRSGSAAPNRAVRRSKRT